jgi:uncharacterized protein YjbI with pentapeptide repeats
VDIVRFVSPISQLGIIRKKTFMKIFISWSGIQSQKIAQELQKWIPQVINSVIPYVTSESIKKGERWPNQIFKELEDSNFGLVCLNKDNLKSPWILFEAGAISKNKDSKLICLLFDGLNQNEVEKPLSFFQNTEFNKEDYLKLMLSINESLDDKKLSDNLLTNSFDVWWPKLESKIKAIIQEHRSPLPNVKDYNPSNALLLLKNGHPGVWNQLRIKNPTWSLVIENEQFKNVNLDEVNLKGCTIISTDFIDVSLVGAKFNGPLTNVRFLDNTIVDNVSILGSLNNVKFLNSSFNNSSINGSHLEGVYFTGSSFNNSLIDGSNLFDINFTESSFNNSVIKGSNLFDVKFINTSTLELLIENSTLSRTEGLESAVMKNSTISLTPTSKIHPHNG